MARAKMGELKRAAQRLGVTSSVPRQPGWKTASSERVRIVSEDAPDWPIRARKNRRRKRAKQRMLRDRKATAARLGIQVRAIKERDIKPDDVDGLLTEPPEWLATEQQRRQAQIERAAKDRLRSELTDALVTSVHEVWFQELKRAVTAEESDAIGARWAPEAGKAKAEARRLAGELPPEQVRARIEREREAAHAAGVYRATQLVRRAFGGDDG